MTRPVDSTIQIITALGNLQPGAPGFGEKDNSGEIEVPSTSGGMFTQIPRDRVPIHSNRLNVNARNREDSNQRREGSAELGTKLDSSRVIGVFAYRNEQGDTVLCRVTQTGFSVWNGSNWTLFTNSEGSFLPSASNVTYAQLFGEIYIANSLTELWKVNFNTNSIELVEDSPRGKFVISWAERIIVANVRELVGGERPSQIVWSVNSDASDWDGESSGFIDLIEDDLGNEITGFFAMENIAVVLRRKSIVHISRQGFALNPFKPTTVIKGYGCDLAYSAVQVPGGIVYADTSSREIYYYRPGSLPMALGAQLNKEFFSDLSTAANCSAAYDLKTKEYHLSLSWNGETAGFSRTWVGNLTDVLTGSGPARWSYDDGPVCSIIGASSPISDGLTIDELVGTIDNLDGTINELGGITFAGFPMIFKGTSTGEIVGLSYEYDHDWDGTKFDYVFQSYDLGSISKRRTLKILELISEAPGSGNLSLEVSKDEINWVNTKHYNVAGSVGRSKFSMRQTPFTGDRLFWRLTTNVPGFDLKSWWIQLHELGLKRGDFS